MASPLFRALGAQSAGSGVATTIVAPTGVTLGDLEIMVGVCLDAETLSISSSGGSAWTLISGLPVSVTGGRKLYAWYRQRQLGDGDPQLTPSADVVCGARLAYVVGTYDINDPLEVETTGTKATSDTSFSFSPGVSSTDRNRTCLVISSIALDSNTASVPVCTNAAMTALVSRANYCTSLGSGGGFGITEGLLATAASLGTWACAYATASPKSYVTFAIKPALNMVGNEGGGGWPESSNCLGPFCDSNGNLYIVGEDVTLAPRPAVFKSMDGGVHWFEIDATGAPPWSTWGDLESTWVIQDTTRLYIGSHRGGSTNRFEHYVFATSDDGVDPDNWQLRELVSDVAATPPNDQAGCLVRRGDDLYAFWNHNDATNGDRIAYKKKPSGGAWGTQSYIAVSTKVLRQPVSIQKAYGSTDTIYILVHNSTDATLELWALNSSDTLSGPTTFATNPHVSSTDHHPIVTPAVRYDVLGTDRILFAYRNTSGTISAKPVDGGSIGSEETVTDLAVRFNPNFTDSIKYRRVTDREDFGELARINRHVSACSVE